jgi:hypothetical protein
MSHSDWRTQIAVLWLLQVINFVSIIFISYFDTGLIAGRTPDSIGTLLAIYFFAFALLIWLAFGLKPAIGRWVHIVCAALTVVLKASYVLQSLGGANSWPFLLNESWGLVAAAILVWVAWKVPKPDI